MLFYLAACLMTAAALVVAAALATRNTSSTNNMFLVLPRVYRLRGAGMRLVIEYNTRVGPVAAHFDDGDRWRFRAAPPLAKWNRFVDDYLDHGTVKIAAVAIYPSNNTMHLTLSSAHTLLSDMVIVSRF
jgi:hypothetical protein